MHTSSPVYEARPVLFVCCTTILLLGALIVGWFTPSDRYEVLAVLLAIVVVVLARLFARLARLQKAVERQAAFIARAEETAKAFGNPDWDSRRCTWRESAWNDQMPDRRRGDRRARSAVLARSASAK